MVFTAYAFKGQVPSCVYKTSENCKSLVLQDKCNFEIFVPCLGVDLFAEKDKQIVTEQTQIWDYFICTFFLIEIFGCGA